MGVRKLDSGYVENLWLLFKTIDDKYSLTKEAFEILKSNTAFNESKENTQMVVRVYAKAAKACSTVNEFTKVLENEEFPPIKLTQAEMEMVKGGISSSFGVSGARLTFTGLSSSWLHGETVITATGKCTTFLHGEADVDRKK